MTEIRNTLKIFSSFEEAEQADHQFYASLSPQERLDLQLELIGGLETTVSFTHDCFFKNS